MSSSISSSAESSQLPGVTPTIPISPPSALFYSPSSKVGYDGSTITSLTPTVTGTVVSYSILPALPTGLSLDPVTGIISGTPTSSHPTTVYTITASNSAGSTTATVSIVIGSTFTISSTGNTGDSVPGDGICDNGVGQCTLRAAIEEANAGVVPARISLINGTYALGGTELTVTAKLSLEGASQAGTIIDAGTTSRAINSTSDSLSISDLTIQNGAGGVTSTSQGGGIKHVKAGSSVTLDHVTIKNNQTGADVSGGGAFYFDGASMTITNSNFDSNSGTEPNGSAIGGGAIYIKSLSSVGTISLTQFINNSSPGSGGAIYEGTGGGLTISDCTLASNSSGAAFAAGGAIYAVGTIRLLRNLFKNNLASGPGGALFINTNILGIIENNTFYANSASSGFGWGKGGAVYIQFTSGIGSTYTNNSFIGNLASNAGGGYYCMNCLVNDYFINTIFSGNSNGNCVIQSGNTTSLGNNIDSGNTCGFASTGDLINTDPLVVAGAPASNGGPTQTIALQAGSPARDAGSNTCPATDQRGIARPINGQCDIGAYEY